MISFFIKHKKSILIVTLAFFIASIGYLGLNAYHSGALSSNAAMVGSYPITYRALHKAADMRAQMYREKGVDLDENMTRYLTQQALSELVTEELSNQAAKQYGLSVADYEVASDIHSSPVFNHEGQFNKMAYEQFVRRQYGLTPAQFEEQMRREKLANRFRQALFSMYKPSPEEVRFVYQAQNGNMKDFDENKNDFQKQLMETKMQAAHKAFMDDFTNYVTIKIFLQEKAQS